MVEKLPCIYNKSDDHSERDNTRIILILAPLSVESGPGSVVGIATGYGLHGPGIESIRWSTNVHKWVPPKVYGDVIR